MWCDKEVRRAAAEQCFIHHQTTSAVIGLAFVGFASPKHDADIFWFCEHDCEFDCLTMLFPNVQTAMSQKSYDFGHLQAGQHS